MDAMKDPLTALPPTEVPLPKAPLVRVIAQMTFPAIVSIGKNEFIAPFQEALRPEYPVLRSEQAQGLILGPQGFSAASPQAIWRFCDVKGTWRVSLAPHYVALDTADYVSRADFIERLSRVLQALAVHVSPIVMDRLGIRYIDRIVGDEALGNLANLVRPEVLSIAATDAAHHVQHSLTESLFSVPPGKAQLLARWGRIPKNSTVDPTAIDPIDQPSWILDLDMFCAESRPFNPQVVVDDVRAYSERIYTFFRWAITDQFLRLYGGKI